MEARLKAIMELDASDVQKELIKTANELKKFERELAKSTDTNDIGRLTGRIRELNADMARLTATANGSAKAMTAVGAATKTASTNSMNFARVIQDLPFGFMGIQNNLTQLVPGIGAAGIAFSALTAAITFSQVGLSYWSRGAGSASTATEDLAKKMDEFRGSAAKELVSFRELAITAADANIPLVQRKQAVEQLQKDYPAYLGNMSQEDILAGKLGGAYDKVVAALRAKIALQAAEEKVIPIIKEQLKVQEDLANAQKTVAAVAGITAKDFAEAEKFATATGKINPLRGLQAEAVAASKRIPELQRAYTELENKIKGMFSSMEPFIKASVGLNQTTDTTKTTTEKNKKFDIVKYRQKMDGAFQESLFEPPAVFEKKQKPSETPVKGGTGDPKYWIALAKAKEQHVIQLQEMAEIAEYGGQVFGQMVNAMMNGQNIGDVLANAFKQIAVQIAAAVAQALIFASLLEAFPALKGVFATVGAVSGSMSQSGGLLGAIRGQDIQLSQRRTSTGMGFRRGR